MTDLSPTAGIVGSQQAARSAAATAFANERKLSVQTLERMGVAFGTVFFPELGRKSEGAFFKYAEGWKARAVPDKAFIAGKGFKLSFWNLENVLREAPSTVYITEGELDACALVEAGIPPTAVLSVPNGAVERPAEADKDVRGYAYVLDALKAGLSKVKKFVWCGDMDGPGRSLRSDMAHILGAARFWFVDWPVGCKDANDVLKHEGGTFLREMVTDGAMQWPIDGLFKLSELPEPPKLVLWNPGFAEWESKIRLAPRTMSVVTGHPGHGKTQLWTQIWFNVVRAYCIPIAIASFETRPKPHIQRYVRTLLSGKLEKDMDEQERRKADAFIEDRYLFMVHPESRPSLKWFLDMAEVAVVRHGARIIQIDPWNRLEASRGRDESETEYIGRCLREMHAFAQDMNCHVQILAHPAKMDGGRRGQAPGLEDISGCYSDDTEVLTKRGWLKHEDVTLDDDVACFDLGHETLRWQSPSKVWSYDYQGEMHRHKYRGGDLLVTPNHRMVAKPGWNEPAGDARPQGGGMQPKYRHGEWQFLESQALLGKKWLVPQAGYWDLGIRDIGFDTVPASLDAGYPSVEFWSYIGWWISEGSLISNGLDVCQAEVKARKLMAIVSAMRLDANVATREPKPGEKAALTMWPRVRKRSHPELTNWVTANCGVGSANKKIPRDVWRLPVNLKMALWDALMAGDGHAHRSGWSYATNSCQLADDVQRLAIELGYTAQVRKLDAPTSCAHGQRYQVNINGRAYSALHPYRNTTVEQYAGKVWCLTVPTGAYVTRRNGWASICGNSKNWDNMVDQGFVVHRPKLFDGKERITKAELHQRKARFEELGYPCVLDLEFKPDQGRYVSVDYAPY